MICINEVVFREKEYKIIKKFESDFRSDYVALKAIVDAEEEDRLVVGRRIGAKMAARIKSYKNDIRFLYIHRLQDVENLDLTVRLVQELMISFFGIKTGTRRIKEEFATIGRQPGTFSKDFERIGELKEKYFAEILAVQCRYDQVHEKIKDACR